MSDDRVAGDGFHEHDLLRRVELRQKCLHAAAIAQEFRCRCGKVADAKHDSEAIHPALSQRGV